MTRLELFVPELAWKNCLNHAFKKNLLALVHKVEFEFQENILREWNIERFSLKSPNIMRSQLFKVYFPSNYAFQKETV